MSYPFYAQRGIKARQMPCHLLNHVGVSFQPARVSRGEKRFVWKKKLILNDLFRWWGRQGTAKEVSRISRPVVKHIERLLNWWSFYIGPRKNRKRKSGKSRNLNWFFGVTFVLHHFPRRKYGGGNLVPRVCFPFRT